MTRIAIDPKELTAIQKLVHARAPPGAKVSFPILAIDPGKRSLGWAVIDSEKRLHSGQGPLEAAVAEIDVTLDLVGAPWLFAAEGPYTVSAKQLMKLGGGVGAIRELGRATGYVQGALRKHLRGAVLWEPKPVSWRAVLGLNRGSSGDVSGRDATAAAVVLWARATTKLPLVSGEAGEEQVDRAMAIGIGFAAHALLTSIRAVAQSDQRSSAAARATPAAKPSKKRGRQPDLLLDDQGGDR